MKNKTQVVEMDVASLIEAEWNYKERGTEEQIEKLAKSITKDMSVGVLAVRQIEKDGKILFEVIDGNHRLQAIQFLKWDKVPVENFGEISLADAVTIARRRNHSWFEDDKLALAKLFTDVVFKEYEIGSLAEFMPDSEEALEGYKNLGEFDWSVPELNEPQAEVVSFNEKKIFLKVPEETYNIWEKWLERCENITGLETPERAFEFAIIEALNIPEESFKK